MYDRLIGTLFAVAVFIVVILWTTLVVEIVERLIKWIKERTKK